MSNALSQDKAAATRALLRIDAGMTPVELASAAKVSLATVTRAEAGKPMQERVIRALAAALGCTPQEYLG